MEPENKQPRTMTSDLTKEEMESAKKVVAALLLAKKNFSLYPEGHVSITNSVDQFHRQLEAYLQKYGNLRLEVEKDQLLSQGEVIYSTPTEEGSLPFIFFRDGIRWLELMDGIDAPELMELLKIVVRYSTLSDEPEGDIVTSFWETQLPHIRYEVADFFWGAEQDADVMPPPELEGKGRQQPKDDTPVDWSPLPHPVIDQAAIALAPEDKELIREMVELEERGDPTGYLDALLDSLLQDRSQDNFEIILEVLEEEFKGSLPRKDFDVALKIMTSLQEVRSKCSAEIPWAIPLLEDFSLTLSSSQSLGPLREVWTNIGPGQVDTVRQILQLLQPEAISTLGAILVEKQPSRLRQVLVEVITSLSRQDLNPLESLLSSPDQRLAERLVHVLAKIEGERSTDLLKKLIHYTSPHVRMEAVKVLLQRGGASKKEIFNLVCDKDESVRSIVLKEMGQTRSEEAEDFLRNYLDRGTFKASDSDHVIACFTTLGRCGSARSIPFLRQTLFGKGWVSMFGTSPHREGAAIALGRMGTKESQQVLEKARRSLIPSVRRAARKGGAGRAE